MPCLKCGRETQQSNVFCDACLEDMRQHPVKPGTPVTIFKRPEAPAKSPGKKQQKPEELLVKYQKKNKRLVSWVIALSVLLALTSIGLACKLYWDYGHLPLGQNYVTETQMPLVPANTTPPAELPIP